MKKGLNIFKNIFVKYKGLKSDKYFGEIFSGSILVFVAKAIAALIGLGISVVIARFYGAEIVGILAIINSYFAIVIVFTLMGTDTSILRLIPEHTIKYSLNSAWYIFKKITLFVLLISVVLGIALFFASNLIAGKIFGRPDLAFLFMIAAGIVVFRTMQQLSIQGIRAIKKIKLFAILNLARPIFFFVSLLIFTFFYYDKYAPVYLQYFAISIIAVANIIVITSSFKKQINKNDKVHKESYKSIFRLSFPMFLTSAIAVLMGELAVIMLGIFSDEKEVGYYAIAFRISALTTFVLQAINTVVAPKFAELYHQGKIDELFYVANKSTKFIFISIIPILLIFVFFGKWIIVGMYGAEFEKSFYLLLILTVGMFIGAISGSVGYFMNMCGFEKIFRNIIFISVLINLLINVILTPRFGAYGAAIAATVSQAFWNLTVTIFIYKKFNRVFIFIPFISKNIK